jgi:hypothetical protein
MRVVALSMLRSFATPLRVLVLVMTFLMASAGHHVAVAANPDAHGLHAAVSLEHGHHTDRDSCPSGGCADAATDCCLMGQCMLAVPLPAVASLRAPTKPVLVAARCFALNDRALVKPFRPPVATEV